MSTNTIGQVPGLRALLLNETTNVGAWSGLASWGLDTTVISPAIIVPAIAGTDQTATGTLPHLVSTHDTLWGGRSGDHWSTGAGRLPRSSAPVVTDGFPIPPLPTPPILPTIPPAPVLPPFLSHLGG